LKNKKSKAHSSHHGTVLPERIRISAIFCQNDLNKITFNSEGTVSLSIGNPF
jgi:hypothetical protein